MDTKRRVSWKGLCITATTLLVIAAVGVFALNDQRQDAIDAQHAAEIELVVYQTQSYRVIPAHALVENAVYTLEGYGTKIIRDADGHENECLVMTVWCEDHPIAGYNGGGVIVFPKALVERVDESVLPENTLRVTAVIGEGIAAQKILFNPRHSLSSPGPHRVLEAQFASTK